MTERAFAIVAGGGTAGHVLPALAVAEALVARGYLPAEIHYVGARRGVETSMLPETPFPHTFLDVDGLQRSFSRSDLRRNVAFGPKMLAATRRAVALIRRVEPRVVVSVGGYASMPPVLAALMLRVPVVVVSYDRTPGRASRLTARWAAASAVAFEGSPIPDATVTGAPIRQRILEVDRAAGRAAARDRLGLPQDRFVVAVMGGSLGSGALNDAVATYVADRRDDADLAVRHIAGERFVDDVRDAREGAGGDEPAVIHQVIGFEHDMPSVYAGVDLLVGRGGASTVHEVATTGTPAILVPWSGAADDHQHANVSWLTDVGGAVRLDEGELRRLGAEIERLRHDHEARHRLAVAAAQRGAVHRSGELAALIERVAVASDSS